MNGVTFVTRSAERRDATVAAMLAAMIAHVPGYSTIEDKYSVDLDGELHHAVRLVVEMSMTDEPISDEHMDFFRNIGRERGAKMFPIADLRAGLKVSYLAGLRDIYSMVDSANHSEILQLAEYTTREHPRILAATESAYTAAQRELGDTARARALVLNHLLAGTPADGVVAAAGVTLPAGYLVVPCRLELPSDPATRDEMLSATLGSRPGALWRAEPRGLLVVLPVDRDPLAARAVAADLMDELSDVADRPVKAAEAYAAELAAVPTAFAEAQQAVRLVAAMPDAQNRPYRMDELLVELAIARQPSVRQRLADQLEPLRNGTELQRTIEVLFECGLDRERTARRLFIHRRTLTYRIKRVRELTGLDPGTAHGIQVLRSALTASRLPEVAGAGATEG